MKKIKIPDFVFLKYNDFESLYFNITISFYPNADSILYLQSNIIPAIYDTDGNIYEV